jgi:hypothetical protein
MRGYEKEMRQAANSSYMQESGLKEVPIQRKLDRMNRAA